MQGYPPPGQGQYYASQYPPQTYAPSYPYPGYPVKPVVPQPAPPQGYPFPGVVYAPQEQYEPAPPMQPHHSQSSSKSRHRQRESSSGLRRSHTTPPPRAPNPNAIPGKSALKKSQQEVRSSSRASGQQSQNNLSRTSSRTSDQRMRVDSASSSRQRVNSIPSFLSEHVFVVISGTNELRVEGMPNDYIVEELRQSIPFTWPHGVAVEDRDKSRWRLQFAGTPWSSSGTDAIIARKMITSLYCTLSLCGFNYVTTTNTSNPPCRLVFQHGHVDPAADFFTILLSQTGEKLSVLGVHPQLAQALIDGLRAQFPHRINFDGPHEGGLHTIEFGRGSASDAERGMFHAYVLRFFSSNGWQLNGSIPMGKTGSLGFGSRKELWIFRGARMRPGSSRSHRSQREY